MGRRYKEIRSHSHRGRNRNSSEKAPQEPRRLSRAGEEFFACLAEDRLRLEREGSQLANQEPLNRGGAGAFSDLRGGEGKSECSEAEVGCDPEANLNSSRSNSEASNNPHPGTGVISPGL